MNIRPTKCRLVVKLKEQNNVSKGGIMIPDSASEKPNLATVEAVGEKVDGLVVGNTVVINKYAGNEVVIDGTKYLIIRSNEVLAVVEDK